MREKERNLIVTKTSLSESLSGTPRETERATGSVDEDEGVCVKEGKY